MLFFVTIFGSQKKIAARSGLTLLECDCGFQVFEARYRYHPCVKKLFD